ncbi:MAG TPA: FtsQ-type POTRA domain-containing protein [Leptolyngbyaceae cyanobacterium M33_DOE_097]|uniref:FtsQ-type POTRA domain-containing protein n=1 Tax=Oscillatoriales cyanobacterium SpSt-418 TaxID=2282169 RepID=A0A7C3PFK0_9CYAN|nr:FtsQ-type POTRA domain-containing protein [Leptolyngbyaceae cyanobacterium M33_DOE_097]
MNSEIVSVSQDDLLKRRKQLLKQRKVRSLKEVWRVLIIASLAGGVVYAIKSPIWVIRRPEQIAIKGSQHIQPQTLRSLLKIAYPQSLWRIEPKAIESQIKEKLPVEAIAVSRQIFPPGLTVQLTEPTYVALSVQLPEPTAEVAAPALEQRPNRSADPKAAPTAGEKLGLLDKNGGWIALERYTLLDPGFKPPTLKVIGNPQQIRPYWQKLYEACDRSVVKISEIDWRDINNLMLKTELGTIRIGAYSPALFAQQLDILSQMKQLPEQLQGDEILSIDLSNPDSPFVQTGKATAKPKNLVKSKPEKPKKEDSHD